MHINKCAGRTVCKWMTAHHIDHIHDSPYSSGSSVAPDGCSHQPIYHSEEMEEDVFYFTTVRHPYDRLYSAYLQWSDFSDSAAQVQTGNKWFNSPWDVASDEAFNDFVHALYQEKDSDTKQFAERFLLESVIDQFKDASERISPIKRLMFKPCADWFDTSSRIVWFHVENLQQLQYFFADPEYGKLKPLPDIAHQLTGNYRHKYTVTHKGHDYKQHYNQRSLEIVRELYDKDFKAFGYNK